MKKSMTLGGAAAAVVIAAAMLAGRPRDLNAAPGWKWIDPFNDCSADCIPVEEVGVHCPCVEMPPIIVKG